MTTSALLSPTPHRPAPSVLLRIDRAKNGYGKRIVRDCGTVFLIEKHIEIPHFAILVRCCCPNGHGVARLPFRGYITPDDAALSLVETTSPITGSDNVRPSAAHTAMAAA